MFIELVIPSLGVFNCFGSRGVEIAGDVAEEINLAVGGRFFEHVAVLCKFKDKLFYISLLYLIYLLLQVLF
jgi:hypothetical protein